MLRASHSDQVEWASSALSASEAPIDADADHDGTRLVPFSARRAEEPTRKSIAAGGLDPHPRPTAIDNPLIIPVQRI